MVQVSLKKAHKIEKELEVLLSKISSSGNVKFSVFTDLTEDAIKEKIEAASFKMKTNFDKAVKITEYIYFIRKLVGEVNHTSGIDYLLTDKKQTEKLLSLLNSYEDPAVNSPRAGDVSEINPVIILGRLNNMLSRAKAVPERGMPARAEDTLDEKVYLPLADYRLSLKKMVGDMDERLTLLNYTANITLSDEVEAFLKQEGIL